MDTGAQRQRAVGCSDWLDVFVTNIMIAASPALANVQSRDKLAADEEQDEHADRNA
jgi:hypothetical protein